MNPAILATSLCLLAAGCSPSGTAGSDLSSVDLARGGPLADLAGATSMDLSAPASMVPTWMLEDVQPASARFGQTYGLEAYSGHTVVVTLVEGF